jgi:hypothetical protein
MLPLPLPLPPPPCRYVRAKHGYGERWPLKEDDLFPYADFPHAYWTGASRCFAGNYDYLTARATCLFVWQCH